MRLIASSLLAGLIAVSAVAPAFADDHGRGHGKDNNYNNGRDWNDRDYRDGLMTRQPRDDRRDDRYRGWSDDRGPTTGVVATISAIARTTPTSSW